MTSLSESKMELESEGSQIVQVGEPNLFLQCLLSRCSATGSF